MASVLQVATIKDQGGNANAIEIANSSANVTINNLAAGTIGGGVAMASSGLTVRNITQVALASDQGLGSDGTLTTYFSPTYTNLFSGSKVLGALTFIGNAMSTGDDEGRKHFAIEFSGSNITDIKLQRNSTGSASINFGGYDYGNSGIQVHYVFTVSGPLLTTNAVSTITAACRLQNVSSASEEQWNVYGNGTAGETHFTWIEYK